MLLYVLQYSLVCFGTLLSLKKIHKKFYGVCFELLKYCFALNPSPECTEYINMCKQTSSVLY